MAMGERFLDRKAGFRPMYIMDHSVKMEFLFVPILPNARDPLLLSLKMRYEAELRMI